jgi:putative ABC transport system permease protein
MVSPVEAVGYTERPAGNLKEKRAAKVSPASMAWANVFRNPKKLAVVVLSLSLSLILLNSSYSIVRSFDMDKYLEYQIASDFSVADQTLYTAMTAQDNFEGVDDGFLAGVSELNGLQDMSSVYFHDDFNHQLSPKGHENMNNALDILEPHFIKSWPYMIEQLATVRETGVAPFHIYGVGKMAAGIINESIDYEKLASGNYVIVTSLIPNENDAGRIWVHEAGDTITLANGAGELRDFEVLSAIPRYPYPLSCGHSHIIESNVIMADSVYLDFYGKKQPMMTVLNASDDQLSKAEEWIADYCKNANTSLDYRSREFYKAEFSNMRNTFLLLGGALSCILALIGILNFANAIFASIIARRHELAMLQSVGMTGKQLNLMLFFEGAYHAALTLLFTLTAGTPLAFAITRLLSGNALFFTWSFSLAPLLAAIAPLLAICAALPLACYTKTSKESLVERLRIE